jgi:hypothetical protein
LLEGESVEDSVGSRVVALLVGIDVLRAFVDGVGTLFGLRVGILVGIDVLGAGVDRVGALVGLRMGVLVGAAVVGSFVGEELGRQDGFSVGADVVRPAVGDSR